MGTYDHTRRHQPSATRGRHAAHGAPSGSGAGGPVFRTRPASAPSWYAGAHPPERVRPSVLVCDDDSQNVHALKAVLWSAGFAMDATSTSSQALDHAAVRAPIAAIVELVLPDGDGVELCRALREWSTMPLIVLSAINEETHKVRALHAGADDYLTKPFGAQELVARLHATLRRAGPVIEEPSVEVGDIKINLAARVVSRHDEDVHLTPIEFDLLRALVRHRGRLLTHRALLREVWGVAYENDRQTLRVHIANLRRKLSCADGLSLIDTHHGAGYRFTDRQAEGSPRNSAARRIRSDSWDSGPIGSCIAGR
jgi:two-component system KDP operon response regulator KdpE